MHHSRKDKQNLNLKPENFTQELSLIAPNPTDERSSPITESVDYMSEAMWVGVCSLNFFELSILRWRSGQSTDWTMKEIGVVCALLITFTTKTPMCVANK
ncbi:hypothetical protein Q1695_006980 [Nippostrongylus brasiliensis]|nr:hypothetical protein Q1695_006980 [Nippostrongylus brasiliensis]